MSLPELTVQLAQRGREYHAWVALCLAWGVERYLELGCATGAAANFAHTSGIKKVVTVDHARGRPDILHPDIQFITANTHDEGLPSRVLTAFEGYNPDAVFIDAGHEYADVVADMAMWWTRTNKLLAFHDILGFGISRLWREVGKNYRSLEIISKDTLSEREFHNNGDTLWGGIGVLFREPAC